MAFEIYLGANTPKGFVSCFSSVTDTASRLYIIKGGPGCGKSTAMRRIAAFCEAEGMETERIRCSSDQDSLDGIRFPELGVRMGKRGEPYQLAGPPDLGPGDLFPVLPPQKPRRKASPEVSPCAFA